MPQSKFRVSEKAPLGLFLRSEPVAQDSTKKAVLPMGQVVTKLSDSEVPNWWEVSTTLEGVSVTGFVSSKFLVPDADFEGPPAQSSVSAVHLHSSGAVTRNGPVGLLPSMNRASQNERVQPPLIKSKK